MASQEIADRSKAKVYIDPVAGKDEAPADGSEAAPYNSLYHALIQNLETSPAPTYLTLVPAKEGSADGPTWEEPAKSAVKKAQGRVDAYKKKLAKESAAAKKVRA